MSLLVLSSITATLNFSCPAEARPCGRDFFSRLGCTLDPTNPRENGNLTANRFTVYVTNNSPKTIVVSARYMNNYKPGGGACSTVDGRGENCPPVETWVEYQWTVAPGETAYIINDAVGRNIVFSAQSVDRTIRWDRKQVDMGSQYGKFTYTFNGS